MVHSDTKAETKHDFVEINKNDKLKSKYLKVVQNYTHKLNLKT